MSISAKTFLGKEALLERQAQGYRKSFVPLVVDNDIAPAHQGDPILLGEKQVGIVTSAAYGHYIGKNIAMGFVDPEVAAVGSELEISIIGGRSRAVVVSEPIFDPKHLRPRN